MWIIHINSTLIPCRHIRHIGSIPSMYSSSFRFYVNIMMTIKWIINCTNINTSILWIRSIFIN